MLLSFGLTTNTVHYSSSFAFRGACAVRAGRINLSTTFRRTLVGYDAARATPIIRRVLFMISPRRHKSFEVVPYVGSISPTRSSVVSNLASHVPRVVAGFRWSETKGKEDDNVAFRFEAFEQSPLSEYRPFFLFFFFSILRRSVAQPRGFAS